MNKIRKEIKKDTKNNIKSTKTQSEKQTGHKLDLPKNLVKNGKLVKNQ